MKKCRYCAEEIQSDAKICKHCSKRQPTVIKAKPLGISLLIAFLFIIFIAVIGGSSKAPKPTPINGANDTEAFIISQGYVKKVLKSPSTADFPSTARVTQLVDGEYIVSSYVDSQNGFGAQIRSDYTATMKFSGGNWADSSNWKITSMILDGEVLFDVTESE